MRPDTIYRHFRRALAACQLYPSGSPVGAEACATLRDALEAAGGASLCFDGSTVLFDGRPILSADSEETVALARRIYERGVREIRFLPGVGEDELLRFLDPLAQALLGRLNPVDEDLSVLFWEADLAHIACVLFEDDPPALDFACEEDDFTAQPFLSEYVDGDLTIGALESAAWEPLSDAEKVRVLAEWRAEVDDEVPVKHGRLLLEILRGECEPAYCERLAEAVIRFLDGLASDGRFALIDRLFVSLRPSLAVSGPALERLERIAAWFRSPSLLLQALPAIDGRPADRAAALARVRAAPSESLPDLVAHVLAVEAPSGASDEIFARLARCQEAALACLRDPRPGVRRRALEVAMLDSDGVRHLRDSLADPDPDIRLLAILAAARINGPASGMALREALSDRDERARITAAAALGRRADASALESLLRVIASRDFEARGASEQRAFYAAALRASPEKVLPLLARIAERRSFWRPRAARAQATEALEAIATLREDAWVRLLPRWTRKRPDLLARLRALLDTAAVADRRAA